VQQFNFLRLITQTQKTMIKNLLKNTEKTLEQWISIVQKKKFVKHGEIINFLKEEHSFTHGFANFVALKSRSADAGSVKNKNELIDKQYKGKENLKPIYDKLLLKILKFGKDIEIAPKNAYVSLKRKKQFAIIQPATKIRLEIGLMLKGQEPKGILKFMPTANAMCTHTINIESGKGITEEVLKWIKASYDKAGKNRNI
jgi:predicted transport protein